MFGWTFRLQQRLININHKNYENQQMWNGVYSPALFTVYQRMYRNTNKYQSLCLEINIEHSFFFFSLFQNRTRFSQFPSERKERVATATIQLKKMGHGLRNSIRFRATFLNYCLIISNTIERVAHAEATQCGCNCHDERTIVRWGISAPSEWQRK